MADCNFSAEEIEEALARIGRSPEWRIARNFFVNLLLSGIPPRLSDGAVREEVGRLNLAREVLNRTDSTSNDHDSQQPDASGRNRPVAGALAGPGRFRGAARRGGVAG